MSNALDSATLKQLYAVFHKFSSLEKAILFGSRAKGTHCKGSDVDLAVKGLTDTDVVQLSMELNEETTLPYYFDVIKVESISSQELLDHIARVGEVVYAAST
ncbi:MAG: nucleotidyltransferase domain-containing protein [Kiritimatiellia bacterium]